MNSLKNARPITPQIALGIALLLSPAVSLAQQAARPQAGPVSFSQQAREQLHALRQEKMSRTPGQRKIASNLLLAARKAANQPLPAGFPQVNSFVSTGADGKALVDLKAKVTDALLARIRTLGGEVVSSHPRYDAIRARIPIAALEALANEAGVRSIRPAAVPVTNKTNTSEGDVAHRANTARSAHGADGSGVKIGVLSDSAESLAALISSGDLPAVTVLSGQGGSGSSEGSAMLEIVHDLAPGASLYFATAFNGEAGFADNILALHAAGCQVIVDDVIYLNEPVFQDGIIAQAVETVCAAGVLYFSSAGNSGNKNDNTSGVWEGNFAAGVNPAALAGYGVVHDFGGGANSNVITVDSPSLFTLQWSDPSGNAANDYDLFLFDADLTTILDYSDTTQDGAWCEPFEAIDSGQYNDTGLRLVVVKYSGEDRYLHLNSNRGRLSISTAGQTWGHSAAASAFSVAAVAASTAGGGAFTGGLSNPVESFSSDGPRRVFFSGDGTPITPGDFSSTGGTVRQKPDIAAADGVATATPGFHPFYGTSAAAPHAAAIAALLWSRQPSLTPAQIRTILTSSAMDIEAAGIDRDSGMGILDAYTALATAAAASPAVSSATAGNADGSYKAGSLINIQVVFNMPVIVTGSPRLALNTTPTRTAEYTSGSGTDTLGFTYVVQNGDASADLDYVSTAALTLNGGTISNEGVNATLVLPAPGSSNSLGANKSLVIDGSAPTVNSIGAPSVIATRAGPVTYTVSFSEPVSGFDSHTDIQVNATGAAAAASLSVSGSGTGPYTVTLSGITGDGTLGITVKPGACADTAGNHNTASPACVPFTVDNTPPTVTSIGSPSATNTIAGPVSYTIGFSEEVTGFDSGDDIQLNATGTAAASLVVSGTGAGPYTVTLSEITGAGTLGITVFPGACTDAVGNQNPASAASMPFAVSRYNLRFTQPAGWAGGLILSIEEGTHTSSLDEAGTLYLPSTSQQAYLDFTVENNGASDLTETTSVSIYLDGNLIATRSVEPPFAAGSTREITDVPVEIVAGSHVLRIVADPANSIPEEDESDNAAMLSFSAVHTEVLDERPPPPASPMCGLGVVESAIMMGLAVALTGLGGGRPSPWSRPSSDRAAKIP